ncbi:MAG TPA: hypothetical protein VNC84_04745 [Gammaproteobacteria bacterium]|jgi:hypothetical protein|nr:hypothetical protein [Gammaproteobacteria bacterium]
MFNRSSTAPARKLAPLNQEDHSAVFALLQEYSASNRSGRAPVFYLEEYNSDNNQITTTIAVVWLPNDSCPESLVESFYLVLGETVAESTLVSEQNKVFQQQIAMLREQISSNLAKMRSNLTPPAHLTLMIRKYQAALSALNTIISEIKMPDQSHSDAVDSVPVDAPPIDNHGTAAAPVVEQVSPPVITDEVRTEALAVAERAAAAIFRQYDDDARKYLRDPATQAAKAAALRIVPDSVAVSIAEDACNLAYQAAVQQQADTEEARRALAAQTAEEAPAERVRLQAEAAAARAYQTAISSGFYDPQRHANDAARAIFVATTAPADVVTRFAGAAAQLARNNYEAAQEAQRAAQAAERAAAQEARRAAQAENARIANNQARVRNARRTTTSVDYKIAELIGAMVQAIIQLVLLPFGIILGAGFGLLAWGVYTALSYKGVSAAEGFAQYSTRFGLLAPYFILEGMKVGLWAAQRGGLLTFLLTLFSMVGEFAELHGRRGERRNPEWYEDNLLKMSAKVVLGFFQSVFAISVGLAFSFALMGVLVLGAAIIGPLNGWRETWRGTEGPMNALTFFFRLAFNLVHSTLVAVFTAISLSLQVGSMIFEPKDGSYPQMEAAVDRDRALKGFDVDKEMYTTLSRVGRFRRITTSIWYLWTAVERRRSDLPFSEADLTPAPAPAGAAAGDMNQTIRMKRFVGYSFKEPDSLDRTAFATIESVGRRLDQTRQHSGSLFTRQGYARVVRQAPLRPR